MITFRFLVPSVPDKYFVTFIFKRWKFISHCCVLSQRRRRKRVRIIIFLLLSLLYFAKTDTVWSGQQAVVVGRNVWIYEGFKYLSFRLNSFWYERISIDREQLFLHRWWDLNVYIITTIYKSCWRPIYVPAWLTVSKKRCDNLSMYVTNNRSTLQKG